MAFVDSGADCVILDGDGEASILLSGTVVKGDILGYSSGWKQALATVATAIQGRCIAKTDGVAGERISAFFDWALLGGARFTGGTPGAELYVAEGTDNGEYTETIPTDSGDCTKIIGYVLSPTIIMITPSYVIDSVV